MNTTDILEKTKKLVSKEREDKHGNKIINHENIARLWTAYFQNKFVVFCVNDINIQHKYKDFFCNP